MNLNRGVKKRIERRKDNAFKETMDKFDLCSQMLDEYAKEMVTEMDNEVTQDREVDQDQIKLKKEKEGPVLATKDTLDELEDTSKKIRKDEIKKRIKTTSTDFHNHKEKIDSLKCRMALCEKTLRQYSEERDTEREYHNLETNIIDKLFIKDKKSKESPEAHWLAIKESLKEMQESTLKSTQEMNRASYILKKRLQKVARKDLNQDTSRQKPSEKLERRVTWMP